MVPVINDDLSPVEEAEEKIAKLKEQIRSLQGKRVEEANDKTKGSKHVKRIARKEIPKMEVDSWYGTTVVFPPHRPRNLRRRMKNIPYTGEVLEDPLPPHFKPISYEYDGSTYPDDHMANFENMALLQ